MLRRELITLLGTSLGGITLAGCAGDGATGPPRGGAMPLPIGFRFFALKLSGGPLPGGGAARTFLLDSAIDDVGDIVFSAVDDSDRRGLYAVRISYAGPVPRIESERRIVRVGDRLPNGETVLEIAAYDTSPQGAIAVVVRVRHAEPSVGPDETTLELWVDANKGGLRRLVYDGMITRDGHVLSGRLGDVDVHSGGALLFSAWYQHVDPQAGQPLDARSPDDDVPRQGLFSIVGLDPNSCTLEVHHEQLSASFGPASIGLIDGHDDGHYVLQATPARGRNTSDNPAAGRMAGAVTSGGAALFTGRVGQHRVRALTALTGEREMALLAIGAPAGESYTGPRAGPDALIAYVLHHGESAVTLYHHGLPVVSSGDRSLTGSVVLAITPPVFGPHGEIYYTLMTQDGPELCGFDGTEQRLLLSYDGKLANDRRRITSLMLGHTTEGTDSAGRLAFVTVFEGGAAAITVGVPA